MNSTALSRHSFLIFACFVALFAIATRSGSLLNPAPKAEGVSIAEAIALVDSGALVIDVRESPKTHIPGALLIPLEVLSARLSQLEAAKTGSIVVYCGNGTSRGPEAAHILTQAGFAHVVNLEPGIEGWRAAGLPLAKS